MRKLKCVLYQFKLGWGFFYGVIIFMVCIEIIDKFLNFGVLLFIEII